MLTDQKKQERMLIAVAFMLCAGIICYNFFFIPTAVPPTVICINDNTEICTSSADDREDIVGEGLVNINTASAEEMERELPGVGKSMAERIVSYRESNGPFCNIEDLKNVKGVGDKKFQRMLALICV